MMTTDESVQR